MKKNIWVINQYASHLDTRHFELSKVFASKGYNVTVITSSYNHGKREYIYPDKMTVVNRAEGVKYIYLRAEPEYGNSSIKRMFNMFGFCFLLKNKLSEIVAEGGEPAYIIASSAPPTVWEVGYSCAKKFGAKFVAEFRDIWPMSLVEINGMSPKHPAVIFFGLLEKHAYRRADAIVGTMPYAYKHVCNEMGFPREKMHWMPNGINTMAVDEALSNNISLPSDLAEYLSNNWCAVYVGSIAKCENIDFLVESFRLLKDVDIKFAIIGEGGEEEHIRSLIDKHGLSDKIRMFPAVRKDQIPAILDKAECCVAAIHDSGIYKYGLSLNKFGDYLYSGKPTIFASEYNSMVDEAGHFVIASGDKEAFAEAISNIKSLPEEELEKLSENGRQLVSDNYDFCIIGGKYLEMLESI